MTFALVRLFRFYNYLAKIQTNIDKPIPFGSILHNLIFVGFLIFKAIGDVGNK